MQRICKDDEITSGLVEFGFRDNQVAVGSIASQCFQIWSCPSLYNPTTSFRTSKPMCQTRTFKPLAALLLASSLKPITKVSLQWSSQRFLALVSLLTLFPLFIISFPKQLLPTPQSSTKRPSSAPSCPLQAFITVESSPPRLHLRCVSWQ